MTNVQYPMTKESGQAAFSGGTSIRASNGFFRDWSFLASLFIVHCLIAVCSAVEPATLGSTTASRFGNLPLYFEANRGQTDEQVGFFARGRDHTVYLRGDGATLALSDGSTTLNSSPLIRSRATNGATVRFVRMTIEGANPSPASSGLEQLSGRVNYLLGNNPSQWQRGVPTFAKVQYSAVYEGVDLVYYGNDQELEYDFFLAPRVDPSVIAMRFDGADQLRIDDRGDLVLRVGSSELRQKKPVAYQTIDGKRRFVTASYKLSSNQTVSFALGQYDSTKALVIDPLLSYSTYLGGSKGDIGWAIAVDSEGRAYVAGDTLSVFTKLPTSGEQTNSGGGTKYGGDAFVARLDFDTNQTLTLGYLTYFGGSGLDAALGIAVDATGAAYLTGYTTSTNFPILPNLGVVQTNISGDIVLSYARYRDPKGDYKEEIVGSFNSHYPDAFVTKLDTNGLGVYSTYLGGELSESGVDIAVDSSGAAYVVGYTESGLTFLVSNRVETARCTNGVCGAAVVTTNLVTPRFLTTGYTVTNDLGFLKSTTNTLQSVVTVTLLSPLDSAPYYAGFPIVNAIQTNNASLATFDIVTTAAKDKQWVTPGTNVLISFSTPADIFIAKLAPDASALVYSTYLGGHLNDLGSGIGLAPDGSVSISGWTDSSTFPVTNAFQSGLLGVRDAVVARLNPAGDALTFSTYLGGRGRDAGNRLAVDAAGATYVTGASASADFPSTPGALNGGGVFTSTNTSAIWGPSSSGLSHTIILTLVADPFNAGTFYSGTPRGVFKTADNGVTWSGLSTGLVNRTVNTLGFEPLTGSPVYAGTKAGLFHSPDGGLLWTNSEINLGARDIRAILFDSATGTNLFVGTSAGVYARVNDTNWAARNKGLSTSVRALVDDPSSILYAGTDGGVFKSTNAGVNWTKMNKGLKTTKVRALVIDPANASTLYAGTTKGIYKTMDAGTNWTSLTNGFALTNRIILPSINSLLIDPTSSLVLYAGTTNGLFRSADAGASWSLSQSNLNAHDVTSLAFAPGNPATIYAGTRGVNFAGGTNDAFLVKFAPDGLSLDYAFTFGGSKNDEGVDVAVDTDGNAYVTGQTASKNFPVRGPSGSFTNVGTTYQTNLSGKIDAFLVKVNADGSSNVLSFYHGGKKTDIGQGIALDPAGNAYIVGWTDSTKLPTTNSLLTVDDDLLKFGGKRDSFVTKFLTGTPALSVEPIIMASGALGAASSRIMVSWPASSYEFKLEARHPNGGDWFPVTEPVAVKNGRLQVFLPASSTTLLFRLRM